MIALVAAFMTAFYMFRLVFLTFFGKERFDQQEIHPHESKSPMTDSADRAGGGHDAGRLAWLSAGDGTVPAIPGASLRHVSGEGTSNETASLYAVNDGGQQVSPPIKKPHRRRKGDVDR